jgi:hypothetical protein
MGRAVVAVAIAISVLVSASLAHARDASLKRALKPYTARLTSDVAYLANFSVPSKSAVPGVLSRLVKIRHDLAGATHAASVNHGSTKAGRKGRALVLTGLHDSQAAASDAKACADAVHSGNHSAASRDHRQERSKIDKAIGALEAGGKLLHLF